MGNIPTDPDFDFHDIRVMGPYPVLILIGLPSLTTSVEVGSLTPAQQHEVSYMIQLNGGELGTPGIELTITAPPVANIAPATTVTLIYEPGVLVPKSGEETWYNLNRLLAQWLGGSGGGGYMYAKDPDVVGHSSLDMKKRILRLEITTHGYICNDDAALRQLRQRLSTATGYPHSRSLDMLTSPDLTGKFYFSVPDMRAVQIFNNDVLNHLQRAYQLRLVPYHQYTNPVNVVGLDMDVLPGFRKYMMCDRTTQGGSPLYSAPFKVLTDTIGRHDARTMTMIHGLGICREEQAHNMYCSNLESASILIKLVRTWHPVLNKATRDVHANQVHGRAAEPIDQFVYLGFCKLVSRVDQAPIRIPGPGSLAYVFWMRQDGQRWVPSKDQAFGMVLEHHPAHATTQADFVLALYLRDDELKQRAVSNPATGISRAVMFKYIRNKRSAQRQLSGIERLGVSSIMNPVLMNLRIMTIPQELGTRSFRDLRTGPDEQLDPSVCSRALGWFLSSSLLRNRTAAEMDVLTIASGIDGYFPRIRTTTGGTFARSVYALMGALMLAGYRFVVAIDELAARSEFAYGLWSFLDFMHSDPMSLNRPDLRSRRFLSCSFVELDVASVANSQETDLSANDHPLRRKMRIVFKFMLGGLAEEAILYDTGAYHSSPANHPPANCTPQAWSMADRISDYLLRNPALRAQYFTDRSRVLNPGRIPEDVLITVEDRVKTIHRAVFAEQDVVICDYTTAMSRDVASSFAKHMLIFGNTHRIPFSKFAAVVAHHSSLKGAILLGHPADQRYGPMQLASRGRNEAMVTFGRSAWDVLELTCGPDSMNLL